MFSRLKIAIAFIKNKIWNTHKQEPSINEGLYRTAASGATEVYNDLFPTKIHVLNQAIKEYEKYSPDEKTKIIASITEILTTTYRQGFSLGKIIDALRSRTDEFEVIVNEKQLQVPHYCFTDVRYGTKMYDETALKIILHQQKFEKLSAYQLTKEDIEETLKCLEKFAEATNSLAESLNLLADHIKKFKQVIIVWNVQNRENIDELLKKTLGDK